MRTFTKRVSIVAGVVALGVILASCGSQGQTQRTPMGEEITAESQQAVVDIATSGEMASVPEGSKVRAVSGNWNEALGFYPTEDQVGWIKSVAVYLDGQVSNGAACYQIDTVFDDVAVQLETDRGRAEYITAAAIVAWSSPVANDKIFECFA